MGAQVGTVRVQLRQMWNAVGERHKHVVVGAVNDHEIKIAVNEDPAEWHQHPNSDEFFLTLEGTLTVEFEDRPAVTLNIGDALVVGAGVMHRTIPGGRTVNLLVERGDIVTVFQEGGERRAGSSAIR